mmetsp:Transcript_179778/g.570194  ORF Transcript_179778/g.570194 Transcript_179778/m.570194 type:complete len:185 (-) Transcript_179778:229-783(-)
MWASNCLTLQARVFSGLRVAKDTSHHGGSPRPSDVAQDDVMEHLIRIELKLGTLSDRLGPGSDGVNTQQAAAPRDRRLGGPVAVHGLQHIVGSTIDTEVEISDGAWFGEGCLLEEGRLFIATVFAVVESELALLPAAEYLKAPLWHTGGDRTRGQGWRDIRGGVEIQAAQESGGDVPCPIESRG